MRYTSLSLSPRYKPLPHARYLVYKYTPTSEFPERVAITFPELMVLALFKGARLVRSDGYNDVEVSCSRILYDETVGRLVQRIKSTCQRIYLPILYHFAARYEWAYRIYLFLSTKTNLLN